MNFFRQSFGFLDFLSIDGSFAFVASHFILIWCGQSCYWFVWPRFLSDFVAMILDHFWSFSSAMNFDRLFTLKPIKPMECVWYVLWHTTIYCIVSTTFVFSWKLITPLRYKNKTSHEKIGSLIHVYTVYVSSMCPIIRRTSSSSSSCVQDWWDTLYSIKSYFHVLLQLYYVSMGITIN